jgi:hypothetical protein
MDMDMDVELEYQEKVSHKIIKAWRYKIWDSSQRVTDA